MNNLFSADKSSELSDEKAAEIVAQLGQVSNQRDDLVKESAEKDVRIQVSFFFPLFLFSSSFLRN